MTGFLVKLFLTPIVLYIADLLFPQVNFTSYLQPIAIGVTIAVIGHLMERMLLRRGTLFTSTAIDVVTALFVLYLATLIVNSPIMSFSGILLTSLLLGVSEYAQHVWILRTGRNKLSGQRI